MKVLTFINHAATTLSRSIPHRAPPLPTTRIMFASSSSSTTNTNAPAPEPKFDHEMAELYHRIAKNHYHEAGPWNLMLQTIQNHPKVAHSSSSFTLLDLASGHGEPSAMIAQTFPSRAIVTSTDYSDEMVALALERAKEIPNMSAQQADMQHLSFPSDTFDFITCSYGFMFPPDKSKAISEAYRCLKPGGMLLATTWDRLPLMEMVRGIMTVVLGESPPPPPLNPMSLAEPDLFENLLRDGGFVNVQSRQSTYPFVLADDDDFSFKMTTMLIKDKLEELGAWDEARKAYDELLPRYATVDDDGCNVIDGSTFRYTVCQKKDDDA